MLVNGRISSGVFIYKLILYSSNEPLQGFAMPEKSILLVDYKHRIIWLDGSITPKMAFRFEKIMNKLNKIKIAPVILYIRGPGGNFWATISMINDISNSPSPVGCVAHGCVASGCFTLTQAGVWRAALPGTKFIFHSAEGFSRAFKKGIQQTQKEISDWLERLRLVDFLQFFWFSIRGRPVSMIQEMLKANMVLSLPVAIKFHLIDKYFDKQDFIHDRALIKKIQKAK